MQTHYFNSSIKADVPDATSKQLAAGAQHCSVWAACSLCTEQLALSLVHRPVTLPRRAERVLFFRTPLDYLFLYCTLTSVCALFGLAGILSAQPTLVVVFFAYNVVQTVLSFNLFVDVLAGELDPKRHEAGYKCVQLPSAHMRSVRPLMDRRRGAPLNLRALLHTMSCRQEHPVRGRGDRSDWLRKGCGGAAVHQLCTVPGLRLLHAASHAGDQAEAGGWGWGWVQEGRLLRCR